MKLSKRIPARTKTVKINWCKKDFLEMNQKFRDVRANFEQPMDDCFWCGHKFIDGEMMSLAQLVGRRNEMLCQSCADELLSSTNKEEGE